MLGKLYLAGKEVPRNEEKAVYWLTQSTEQGNQYAQYLLDHLEENRPPSVMLAVTRLLHHMSRVFRDNSVPKSRRCSDRPEAAEEAPRKAHRPGPQAG